MAKHRSFLVIEIVIKSTMFDEWQQRELMVFLVRHVWTRFFLLFRPSAC